MAIKVFLYEKFVKLPKADDESSSSISKSFSLSDNWSIRDGSECVEALDSWYDRPVDDITHHENSSKHIKKRLELQGYLYKKVNTIEGLYV